MSKAVSEQSMLETAFGELVAYFSLEDLYQCLFEGSTRIREFARRELSTRGRLVTDHVVVRSNKGR